MDERSLVSWFWILEYLSYCQDVDTRLLNDLIEKAPNLHHKHAKNAREMISLRLLQDLFVTANAEKDTEVPIFRTGFSEKDTCEDVVNHILSEPPLSESTTSVIPKMKKWDVLPFIMHKRVSLPKCFLLQVKDSVSGDSGIFPESLKQKSKLFHRYEHTNGEYTDRQNHDAPSSSRNNKINFNFSTFDHPNESPSDLSDKSFSLNKTKRVNTAEASIFQPPKDTDPVDGDKLNSNENKRRRISPSKGMSPEQNTQQQTEILVLSHQKDAEKKHVFSKTRRPILDKSPSEEQQGNVRDVSGDVLFSNGKTNEEILPSNGKSLEENVQQERPSLKEFEKTTNYSTKAQDKDCIHTENDGKNNCNNKSKTNEDQHLEDGEHMSPEGLLNVDPSTSDRVYTNMEDEDALKRHYLSSSQWTVLLKSSEVADCIEKYSCVKCNKGGGQLMVCSSSSCPIVAHEGCLGSNPHFDEHGNFYCPFCAYTHAMSQYMEADKKSSLARKCLSSFLGVEFEKQRDVEQISGGGQTKPNDIRITEVREPSTTKSNTIDADVNKENSNHQEQEDGTTTNKSPTEIMENPNIPRSEFEDNVADESEMEEDSSPAENEVVVNATCNQPGVTHDSVKPIVSLKSVLNSLLDKENSHEKHEENTSVETVVEILQSHHQHLTSKEKACLTPLSRSRRETNRESYASVVHLPLCRRRKIPWTILEEETLKEGVERLSSEDCKNIPWKRILEFGNLAFEKGRTAVDLKDKWRNMCRRIST